MPHTRTSLTFPSQCPQGSQMSSIIRWFHHPFMSMLVMSAPLTTTAFDRRWSPDNRVRFHPIHPIRALVVSLTVICQNRGGQKRPRGCGRSRASAKAAPSQRKKAVKARRPHRPFHALALRFQLQEAGLALSPATDGKVFNAALITCTIHWQDSRLRQKQCHR